MPELPRLELRNVELPDAAWWMADALRSRWRMATVSVRYIVDDVDAAIAFYRDRLGFREEMHPAPTFAMLCATTFGLCSARRAADRAAARRCLTARCRLPAGGIASSSR